jgi:hypothetical protein
MFWLHLCALRHILLTIFRTMKQDDCVIGVIVRSSERCLLLLYYVNDSVGLNRKLIFTFNHMLP